MGRFLLAVITASIFTGCSGGSYTEQSDELQQRLSMHGLLSEMNDREFVDISYLKELNDCAKLLPATFSDAAAAQAIIKDLRKSSRDKEQIVLLTKKLADLLPLPEKYARFRITKEKPESSTKE